MSSPVITTVQYSICSELNNKTMFTLARFSGPVPHQISAVVAWFQTTVLARVYTTNRDTGDIMGGYLCRVHGLSRVSGDIPKMCC